MISLRGACFQVHTEKQGFALLSLVDSSEQVEFFFRMHMCVWGVCVFTCIYRYSILTSLQLSVQVGVPTGVIKKGVVYESKIQFSFFIIAAVNDVNNAMTTKTNIKYSYPGIRTHVISNIQVFQTKRQVRSATSRGAPATKVYEFYIYHRRLPFTKLPSPINMPLENQPWSKYHLP